MWEDDVRRRNVGRLKKLREDEQKFSVQHMSPEDKDEPRSERSLSHSHWESTPVTEREHEQADVAVGYGVQWFVRTLLSFFLVSSVYAVFSLQIPYAEPMRHFVREALTREFNFTGMYVMVEQAIGVKPDMFPVLAPGTSGERPVFTVTNSKIKLQRPVQGVVVQGFGENGKGILIKANQTRDVKAAEEGWIVFLGQKEGLGQTVVIQHADKTQSWYTNIDTGSLAERDWVQSGQMIGTLKQGKQMLFAIVKDQQYIDPQSVISFE